MSDFSIEYILNRAGDKYAGTNGSLGVMRRERNTSHYHPYMINLQGHEGQLELLQKLQLQQQLRLSPQQDQMQQQQPQQQQQHFLDQIPVLDWLQYTRYHPPKLQRSLRQGPSKRTPGRLPRIPFTPAQLQALESAYKASNYLSAEDANKLADSLDLTNTRVKIWFQNRRARERRDRREKEESSYDSTLSSNASSPEPEDVIDIV
ncbi:homeobox protein GHOX-7-like [Musca vetustissima]|uniref:homeobox protein GHOX-7-like n=1 Tax=Musca vetustissima TaxID=27455 RepID=UPI002AB69454|nr:homeobox protein GHOX-7-like [Musca vetustissima]